jgi:hypothetical protein
MSLLGFDSSGRMALGQLPVSRHLVLTSARGSYTVAGQAASFGIADQWIIQAAPGGVWTAPAEQVEAWSPASKQHETWIPE